MLRAPAPSAARGEVGATAPKPATAPGVPVIPPAAAEPLPAASNTGATVPAASEGKRVFLQLGAFRSRENAEGFLGRLKPQADWLALQIRSSDGLYRVEAGPYASQTE